MNEPHLTTIKSHEARIKMSELLDSTLKGSHTLITRNGRPVAILVAPDWYEQATVALAAIEQGE